MKADAIDVGTIRLRSDDKRAFAVPLNNVTFSDRE
jgi:hypothetical protein